MCREVAVSELAAWVTGVVHIRGRVCSLAIGRTFLHKQHSYHAVCDSKFALAYTEYGYEFVSAVEYENVYGFQPHPEKSHECGLKIIKNFMEI